MTTWTPATPQSEAWTGARWILAFGLWYDWHEWVDGDVWRDGEPWVAQSPQAEVWT